MLVFQWLFGFITFLFPGLKAQMRAAYLDVHVFFGLTIFVSACAAAFTGFTEKTIFGLSGGNYLHYDPGDLFRGIDNKIVFNFQFVYFVLFSVTSIF